MRLRRRYEFVASRVALAVVGACALTAVGCFTSFSQYVDNGFKVGPNYAPPPVPVAATWEDSGDARVAIGQPNLGCWWDVFADPVLVDLIHRAYSSNLTLRAAGFHILASEEQRRIAASELLPQSQTATAAYTRSESSANGGFAAGGGAAFGAGLGPGTSPPPVSVPSTPIAGITDPGPGTTDTSVSTGGTGGGGGSSGSGGPSRFSSNWATALNLSWELDFWGLFRRNLEAANASLDQSVFNSDEMTVLMLASVATQYVQFRTLQRRLELARRNVAQQEPLVAQFEQRYRAGIANSLPGYAQLRANLFNTRALIPQLEISLRNVNNQLCSLLGLPMQDLTPILGDGTLPDAKQPDKRHVLIPRPVDSAVVVGIPGEVLLQRPDVRAAEQQLKIQSAEIGISEAEMFPHVGINGSIGLAANRFSHLFNAQSGTGSIGPSLSWNIFNYGRLLANVRLQNQVYQQYVAQYQQALLNANQDAENALAAYLLSMEQAQQLRESAASATELTDYLVRLFAQGYLPPGAADTSAFINQLFTAFNFQVQQQDAAAQAEGNVALNLILLYRAMGGGWQLRLCDPNHPGTQITGGTCQCQHCAIPPAGVVPVLAAPVAPASAGVCACQAAPAAPAPTTPGNMVILVPVVTAPVQPKPAGR